MGWYGTNCGSKRDLIRELTTRNSNGWVCIAHAMRGATLWAVYEKPAADGLGERIIESFTNIAKDGDGWGYKPVSESMGPCDLSCPVSYFDLVPEPPSDYAREFRENVRARHAAKSQVRDLYRSLRLGMRVDLPHCKGGPFRVTFAGKRKKTFNRKMVYEVRVYCEASGNVYRLGRRHARGMKLLDETIAA
jgi:hypothetical protein